MPSLCSAFKEDCMSKVVADFRALKLTEMAEAFPLIEEAFNQAKEKRRQDLEAEIRSWGFKPGEAVKKPAAAPKYRGPNGEAYSGRGALPKWATDAGVTNKEEMERFRVT